MADLPLLGSRLRGDLFACNQGRRVSVDDYLGDVRSLAAVLPAGAHIINLCTNRYRFAVGFGAALLRRQVTLLPPNLTPHLLGELQAGYPGAYCLSDANCDANFGDKDLSAATAANPGLETFTYRTQTANAMQSAQPVPTIAAEQTAAILFTSGSTGRPVPQRQSWGALVRCALAKIDALELHRYPGMVLLGTLPPQHMFGLEATVFLALQGELAMHAGRPFFPADICAELEQLPRPRALVTSPLHLRSLLEAMPQVPPVDFLLSATAPLAPQLAALAETRFGAPLYEIYGCTETGQVASRRTTQSAEWQAAPGVELRQDERGTWVRGGHVEGEVLLGDSIELRARGRFLLHGRTADMVNIAGKRTSLAHLNHLLNSIDGVRDGAFVFPDDDALAVARLMVFVVAPALTPKELMRELRRCVDPAFLPRPLCFVDSLPRDATGKLSRSAIKQMIAANAAKVT